MPDDEAENTQLVAPGPGGQPMGGGTRPESPWLVSRPCQPDRPGLLGWPDLGGQEAVGRHEGLAHGGGRPRRGLRKCEWASAEPASLGQSLRGRGPGAGRGRPDSRSILGGLLLLVSGVALMYGSIGAWVHVQGTVSFAHFGVSLNGTDPGISTLIGVNGWATFIGGILIVIFACFEMTSEELQLAILTTVIAGVTTIFALYDMFRIVQKINQVPAAAGTDVSVGWGLICVLSAAVLATLSPSCRLLQR